PCRLESSIPAEHTLVARQLTAYRFRARFYPLNGDADETMTMAMIAINTGGPKQFIPTLSI
ncbi:MAG: hypothetical protein WAN46_14415, partial [Gammaproteobacteria bacterium]